MKKERLDQILLRMGFITEDDVQRALEHQAQHGGRLGSVMVYLGFITEAELVHALCEQHQVPGFFLDEHRISRATVKKIQPDIAERYQILPFDFHEASRTISVAAVDPGESAMVTAVKKAYRAKAVEIYVASESLLRLLITHYYRGPAKDGEKDKRGRRHSRRKRTNGRRTTVAPLVAKAGGFAGSLGALSFIDLLQALAQASKTVHIHLAGTHDERAEVYLRRGRMVHAECGSESGVDAIYRIIGWGDDGTFSVEPTKEFPIDNIFEANEVILMEGCRLMDEATYDDGSRQPQTTRSS